MPKHAGAPIIIKKVKKGGDHGHHGGAWKVAYADFVTAMMAFFLLLWLLNVTTDVQKRGIADYFDPTLASKSNSGAGGVLGGQTIGQPGSQVNAMSVPSFEMSRSSFGQPIDDEDNDSSGSPSNDQNDDGGTAQTQDKGQPPTESEKPKKLTEAELQKQLGAQEQKRFEAAKAALLKAVTDVPELKALAKNLMIDETPEGLRIQIVDQDKTPMFPLGSADMLDSAKKLIALITEVVAKLPNKIAITGHTDSTQYALSAKYTNWELSADRANAARRQFITDGLPAGRVTRVVGVADTEPLDKTDPSAPHNRRISIVLLRETKDQLAAAAPAAAAASATATPAPGKDAATAPAPAAPVDTAAPSAPLAAAPTAAQAATPKAAPVARTSAAARIPPPASATP
jgi:chemotaxis protein MotB